MQTIATPMYNVVLEHTKTAKIGQHRSW